MKRLKIARKKICIWLLFVFICILLISCWDNENHTVQQSIEKSETVKETVTAEDDSETFSRQDIPEYYGNIYIELNNNEPEFIYDSSSIQSYESYSDLDSMGRCGVAESCIGIDSMPKEERGAISQVKPSGWHTIKYDNIDGKYLYNRCHLMGYQLTGENDNEKNLITGTRYMNTVGMLPFENLISDYIRETNNHVMYRVTPVFKGENLLVSGVQMEAQSLEDNGEGISYNVFIYNIQPGIVIDYATGDSRKSSDIILEECVKKSL